jgi:UPF0176 protein
MQIDDKNECDIVVWALYEFVHLPDYKALKLPLLKICEKNRLRGTILLAEEGINGTLAGNLSGLNSLMLYLRGDERFVNIEYKESLAAENPFYRMKVKLKKEIVSMGIDDIRPHQSSGIRVEAQDWNQLISDPDVLLIDTRNQYEIEVGSFTKAASPETDTFREFPDYVEKKLQSYKHKKIAMYCTGGIRCEKASAYMRQQGFDSVYQLNGGILKYLEEVDSTQSLWQGECFVFDGRVAVDQGLKPGGFIQCYACRRPLGPELLQSEQYEEGVSCPYCYEKLSEKKRLAVKERQKQVKLAEERNQDHIGAVMSAKPSFKKPY